jgi:hypothetical protein
VPAWAATVVGRCVATAAWFGVVIAVASTAAPRRRRVAFTAATFVGGIYTLTLFGSAARPDSLAVAFAGLGLTLALRAGRLDTPSGVLFALGAWTKPNVWGIALGVLFAGAWLDRKRTVRAVLGALGVSATLVAVLHRASDGRWLEHLVRSTAQPMMWSVWARGALFRLQFQGAPLAVALIAGWRGRHAPSARIAFCALAGSLAWALVSLSKIGSSACYWMEPLLAMVAVAAQADVPRPSRPALALGASGAMLLQAIWTGVATVRSSVEAIGEARVHARFVATARDVCGARPGEVVFANEPGLEMMLNGRVLSTPFQLTHLSRRGRYPLGPWLGDVQRPEVRCALMQNDLLERPPDLLNVAHDELPPEMRRALRAKFVRVAERGGWMLYGTGPGAALR